MVQVNTCADKELEAAFKKMSLCLRHSSALTSQFRPLINQLEVTRCSSPAAVAAQGTAELTCQHVFLNKPQGHAAGLNKKQTPCITLAHACCRHTGEELLELSAAPTPR